MGGRHRGSKGVEGLSAGKIPHTPIPEVILEGRGSSN